MLDTTCWVVVLSVVLWTSSTESARILGLFPMPAHSHYFVGHKLLKELAVRGHDVIMVSSFSNIEPMNNYRDIVLNGTKDIIALELGAEHMTYVDLGSYPSWLESTITARIGSGVAEVALQDPNLQNLLKSNESFDLVIIDMFYTELLYGIAHRFNCPLLAMSTLGSSICTNHLVGNPAPNSYVPDFFLRFFSPQSFYQRLLNAIQNLIIYVHRKFFYFPRLDAQLHEYFPDAPPLAELMYSRTVLVLLNTHPSVTDARPHVPNMIEIGGFHIDKPKPLPQDLKDFMDAAKHGVILFSMGANLKSTDLNNKILGAIVKSFAKLKQQVIWKSEETDFPGKPENVKTMKWCPQNDILAHPNLKLFITHGGLLSTTEAVYHAVPMIGIPIFGDQGMNVATYCKNEIAIRINYADVTEESFTAALHEVLNNSKYLKNVKRRSQLFRDQPMRPIDTAVYWTEFVIKHRGAEHLRTAAMDLEWYQIYSIDLFAFLIVICATLWIIIKKMLGRNKKQTKKDAKKKKK